MKSEFVVGDLVARPGEKVRGFLKVRNSELEMPITLINGTGCGKTVVITGGIHGGEYPGIETSIRLANELTPSKLSGQVAIVHPANVVAFLARMQYTNPLDGQNLNRMFPGRALGTVSERIAYTITTELHAQADFYMDLHGGDIHEALVPFVIYPLIGSDEVARVSREAAALMGITYVVGSRSRNGTFGSAALSGVPGFLGEIGQCGRWSETEVEDYLSGVRNVLRYLSVLDEKPIDLGEPKFMDKMVGIDARRDGCFYPSVKPGDVVVEGQKLGEIRDFFGETLDEYTSPCSGIVLYVISSLAIVAHAPLVAVGIPSRTE